MIWKGKCISCGQLLRANGQYQFKDEVRRHFAKHHPNDVKGFEQDEKDADEEYQKLRKRYPGISFALGRAYLNPLKWVENIGGKYDY